MKKKIKWDIHCPACSRKFLKEDLKERGFVDITKVGECITCPDCEYQWIDNLN